MKALCINQRCRNNMKAVHASAKTPMEWGERPNPRCPLCRDETLVLFAELGAGASLGSISIPNPPRPRQKFDAE